MEKGTRLFNESHEWLEALGDDRYRIGISDYAQDSMGDVVFVDLPDEDDELSIGDSFAEAESVKAVSEIFSPVDGVVVAVNDELDDNPAAINEAPYDAWMIEVKATGIKDDLMTEEAYLEFVKTL